MRLRDNQIVMLRDGVFLLLAALLVGFYTRDGGFPLDDSWIHQVYGRNLGQHSEWSFISGDPSAASTAPFYTVMLAVGYALNLPHMVWTHTLGVLALAVAAMIGARMVDKLLPDDRIAGLVAGLTLIFSWHLLWAAASGMETMLFSTLVLALMWLAWRDDDSTRSGVIFGVVAALTVSTRPEGILAAGLAGLVYVVHRVLSHWRLFNLNVSSGGRAEVRPYDHRRDSRTPFLSSGVDQPGTIYRAPTRWIKGAMGAFAIMIAPYLLLNLSLGGGLLPDTSEAKYIQHRPLLAQPYLDRLWGMTEPILAGAQALLIPGMVYMVYRALRCDIRWLLPLFWAVGLIALYAARLPATYQHGRYVIPALPGLIVLGAAGTYYFVVVTKEIMLARIPARTLAAAAVVSLVYFALVLGRDVYRTDVAIIEEEMVAPAQWMRDNLPQDALLAVHDIGAVGYFADRLTILDIAGLVSPEVTPLIGDPDGLWALMQERDARYLMAFTDQVPGQDVTDPRLCFHYQSDGTTATANGGSKMVIYRLAWDGDC